MTEHAWLTSTSLEAMLRLAEGRVSRRKLMLFGCAVAGWRAPGGRTPEDRALRLAERLADGSADEPALRQIEATMAGRTLHGGIRSLLLQRLLAFPTRPDGPALTAALTNLLGIATVVILGGRSAQSLFEQDLVARLRDIAGDPFRPAAARPVWLAWNGGEVPRLARALYDEGRFNELPYLADALEDAGCDDEVILRHLRGDGLHVRGCWAVDLLVGLE